MLTFACLRGVELLKFEQKKTITNEKEVPPGVLAEPRSVRVL